jgi:hypothetical protein
MEGMGNNILAHARLALNQDRRTRLRYAVNVVAELHYGRAHS